MHPFAPIARCCREFTAVVLATGLAISSASADELEVRVHGLSNTLERSVELQLESLRVSGEFRLTERRRERIVADAERRAAQALRPFGYYHAAVTPRLTEVGEGAWRLDLDIERGPPLRVASAAIHLTGPGAELRALRDWRDDWPLTQGKRLDQTVWEARKQAALDIADANGYLTAQFVRHRIEADLERNEARLELELETGPRAVMGEITFNQDALDPAVLALLPRFTAGQPYDAFLLEKFRLDVWRTGYFKEVEVLEERRLEDSPPRVNLVVNTTPRPLNTWQGSVGYGTDTQVRLQLLWSRHLVSTRGDTFDVGIGWQQKNEEYSFRSSYRLPRKVQAREFWTADFYVRRQNQDLEVKATDDAAEFVQLTNGNVIDYSLTAGRLKIRDLERGYQQLFENWYLQYVLERSTFDIRDFTEIPGRTEVDEQELEEFRTTDSSISLGINWDWPAVRGKGFASQGHHERARLFTANEAWGSGKEFTQAYIESNWHRVFADRWKVLLRAQLGYSDADVSELEVVVDDQRFPVSVTDLPNLYRFKAGGSRSVRGYAFESLSNNGIGSNHIITGSAELEYQVRTDWSLAAFYDFGNAFNDWDDKELRRGIGLGLRWYSIAGPVRLDIAHPLDFEGEDWRIHFSIGTPLL